MDISRFPLRKNNSSNLFPLSAGITVSPVEYSSENTIVVFVTCGCRTKNVPTIVSTVDFAVWVVLKTSSIAMTVACALIGHFLITTTARQESTSRTVLSVKNIYFHLVPRVMKCLVDMPFTGIVSDNWLLMIHVVRSVRRQQRLEIV
jgi:hypothetical protein